MFIYHRRRGPATAAIYQQLYSKTFSGQLRSRRCFDLVPSFSTKSAVSRRSDNVQFDPSTVRKQTGGKPPVADAATGYQASDLAH